MVNVKKAALCRGVGRGWASEIILVRCGDS
jgi:hypothetical protein